MEETEMPPVHEANIVATSGSATYGVEGIDSRIQWQW